MLFDAMKTELLEKIRRLEEDRQNIDLTSGTTKMSIPKISLNVIYLGNKLNLLDFFLLMFGQKSAHFLVKIKTSFTYVV